MASLREKLGRLESISPSSIQFITNRELAESAITLFSIPLSNDLKIYDENDTTGITICLLDDTIEIVHPVFIKGQYTFREIMSIVKLFKDGHIDALRDI